MSMTACSAQMEFPVTRPPVALGLSPASQGHAPCPPVLLEPQQDHTCFLEGSELLKWERLHQALMGTGHIGLPTRRGTSHPNIVHPPGQG